MSAVVLGSSTPKVGTFRPFYGVPLVNCASQNRRGRQRFSIVCEYDRGQCYRRPARLLSNGTGPLVARERNSFRSPSPTTRPLRRRARRMLPGSILNAAVAQQKRNQQVARKKAALVEQNDVLKKFMEENELINGIGQLRVLLQAGLSFSNLRKILRARIQVLSHKPSTITRKLRFFTKVVGMSNADLKKMLVKFPRILEYNTRATITPRIKFLQGMGLQMEDMPKMFLHAPAVFELSVENTLIPRLQFLEDEVRIPRESLRTVLVRHPQLVTYSEDFMRERVNFMRSFGLSDGTLAKTIVSHPQLLHYSISGMESRIEFLRDTGVSKDRLPKMISRLPQLLCLNIKVNLAPKVEFLRDQLGGCNRTIETNPTFLALSLQNRIIPRYEFMKVKSLKAIRRPTPMDWFKCSDRVFAGKFAKVPLEEFIAFKESMCA